MHELMTPNLLTSSRFGLEVDSPPPKQHHLQLISDYMFCHFVSRTEQMTSSLPIATCLQGAVEGSTWSGGA